MELLCLLALVALCGSEGKEKKNSSSDYSLAGDLIGGCCKLIIMAISLPFTLLFSALGAVLDHDEKERKNYLTRGY